MSASLTVYVLSPDLERTRRFYEEGLGIRAGEQQGNWAPFPLNTATFAPHAALGEDGADITRPNYSFGVDDVEAVFDRFTAAGATVLRGVADETFGRMATLQDPDGRTFEIVQHE